MNQAQILSLSQGIVPSYHLERLTGLAGNDDGGSQLVSARVYFLPRNFIGQNSQDRMQRNRKNGQRGA